MGTADGIAVAACSALKRDYRDRLATAIGATPRFVYLQGAPDALRQRLEHRCGHYMPASLLESQLATLEEPGADENVLVVAPHRSPEASVADILAALRLLPK